MSRITPVILAAGDSLRMGYPKALLPLGGKTFLTHILGILKAARLSGARVVLGAHAERIRPLLRNQPVSILVNPDPARGQGSSMRLAAANLPAECEGCLMWPVDQPQISPDLVRNLARIFLDSAAPLAMPRCGGKPGHPAIFGQGMIRELLAAPSDVNPKLIVRRYMGSAAWLPTEEAGTIEDIDTPADYFRLTGEKLESALSRRKRESALDG